LALVVAEAMGLDFCAAIAFGAIGIALTIILSFPEGFARDKMLHAD
jgi:hypothetical protein